MVVKIKEEIKLFILSLLLILIGEIELLFHLFFDIGIFPLLFGVAILMYLFIIFIYEVNSRLK